MTERPCRRIPSRTYKDYKSYKKWIREDFHYRCAYCSIHENQHGGFWHFHVDHHRPKAIFTHLITEYSNLLYSCDHCNIAKGDMWPSDDPLTDGVGWLDPCEHDLKEHYYYGYLEGEFTLVCLTVVGRWMATMLALDQPVRIQRHRKLVEEEQLDTDIAELIREFIEKSEHDYRREPTTEKLQKIARNRQTLRELENKLINRYSPEPYISIRRNQG